MTLDLHRLASRPLRVRLVRYASVSAVSTVTSLCVLGLLVGLVHLDPVWSNVAATAVGTVPSFELNRRWVWSRRAGGPRAAQIVPFVALSLAGLVVSSLTVHFAAEEAAGSPRDVRTLTVELANVAAYGSLWLVQFFVCDRLLFASRRRDAR